MSYVVGIGQWQPGLYGGAPGRPDMPSGMPGPFSPGVPGNATPATTPYRLFPLTAKVGDVINVTGDFGRLAQGQALVRFAGAPAQAIAILGGFGGSVVVPEGAQSGACQIEVDGRTVFGANCAITQGSRERARAPEHPAARSWKNAGTGSPLAEDDMGYIRTGLGTIDQLMLQRARTGTPETTVVSASRAGTGFKRDTTTALDHRTSDAGAGAGAPVVEQATSFLSRYALPLGIGAVGLVGFLALRKRGRK